MKYAVLGAKNAIFDLTDREPKGVPYVKITEEQAKQVREIQATFGIPRYIDGEVTTTTALMNQGFYLSVDEETNQLVKVPVPKKVYALSKLTLKRKLESFGKWERFKAVLSSNASLDDEFWLAQSISTDDAMFTTHAEAIKKAVGLSDEEFSELTKP
jgi:hypothetical protein